MVSFETKMLRDYIIPQLYICKQCFYTRDASSVYQTWLIHRKQCHKPFINIFNKPQPRLKALLLKKKEEQVHYLKKNIYIQAPWQVSEETPRTLPQRLREDYSPAAPRIWTRHLLVLISALQIPLLPVRFLLRLEWEEWDVSRRTGKQRAPMLREGEQKCKLDKHKSNQQAPFSRSSAPPPLV